MSDPTDTGQRNPLSSSTAHASGTSARSVSIQPDQASVAAAVAQDDDASTAALSGAEAGLQLDPEPQAEAGPEPEAEAGAQFEAAMSQPEAAGTSDEPAPVTEQQDIADQPEAAAELAPSPEPVVETYAEYSQPAAEPHSEDAGIADQPLIGASISQAAEEPDEVSAFVDEPADTAATDAPADTADAPADIDAASPDAAADDDASPAPPLPNGSFPAATTELAAAARQAIAENEARQEKALALFDQVSRRFTAALEEAGVDAARVTFKVMEFAQANLKNNLELAKSYTAVRSIPDIFGLHAAYIARQFELLNAQAEALREMSAKIALRNTASLKPQAEPTIRSLDNR